MHREYVTQATEEIVEQAMFSFPELDARLEDMNGSSDGYMCARYSQSIKVFFFEQPEDFSFVEGDDYNYLYMKGYWVEDSYDFNVTIIDLTSNSYPIVTSYAGGELPLILKLDKENNYVDHEIFGFGYAERDNL